MTSKQITALVKKTVVSTLNDLFLDPDFGKTVKKTFLKSLKRAKAEKGGMTIAQFRKEYGF